MQPSRIVAVLSLLMLAAVVGATGWRFLRAEDAVEPIVNTPASPAPASPAPASALVPPAEPSTWGVVAVVPCHRQRELFASGDVVYGCRDLIDASTGRFARLGTFADGRILDNWELLAAVHGDLIVHDRLERETWYVTRASTGEEVFQLDFGTRLSTSRGQQGNVAWWEVYEPDTEERRVVGLNLTSMSRIDFGEVHSDSEAVFDTNGAFASVGPCASGSGTCLQQADGALLRLPDSDATDGVGAAGPGRLWVLNDGALRWIDFAGHDDPTFEPRTGVEAFSVLDATEDRVLASLKLRDEGDANLLLFSRDPHSNQWRASAPIREPIFSWGPSVIDNPSQILDSGRIAMLVGDEVYLLAEGGQLETPPPPAASPLDGMVAMAMDDDGVWRSEHAELQPPPPTAAVFVRPARGNQRERFVRVEFLHRELFANLPDSELSLALRDAVLPSGASSRVRGWRENGARRWRMETTTSDCTLDLIAFDVLERGDFFEVRQTHLGAACEELSGNRAEACHAAVDVFGPVPADAESVPGLPDGYEGDASLEP